MQISSNVIVVIAIDRLLTVVSASHHRPERAHKRTSFMLLNAWVAALIISAPQFAVWRAYEAFPSKKWSQCMQIWEIFRAEAVFNNNTAVNSHKLMREENVYVVLHMLLIFWIPAMVVLVSAGAPGKGHDGPIGRPGPTDLGQNKPRRPTSSPQLR